MFKDVPKDFANFFQDKAVELIIPDGKGRADFYGCL